MEEVFKEILNNELGREPRHILLLCETVWRTEEALRDFIKESGLQFLYKRNYSDQFIINNLKISVQYVNKSGRWFECLRGRQFNKWYSTTSLTDRQLSCVQSRIFEDYDWVGRSKSMSRPLFLSFEDSY